MQYSTYPPLLSSVHHRTGFQLLEVEAEARAQMRSAERAAFYLAQDALAGLTDQSLEALSEDLFRLHGLLEGQIAQAKDSGIPYQGPDWLSSNKAERAAFLDAEESTSAFGKLVCEAGKSLPAVFNGEMDASSVMKEDSLLDRFDASNISVDHAYRTCARWVKLAGRRNPQMRILQLGARTGHATTHILQALTSEDSSIPAFASLDFTDRSEYLVTQAKVAFEKWGSLINYHQLDIRKDPVEQGLKAHSYDLIFAPEGLRTAAPINESLRNIHSLVKTEGKLLLVEATTQTICDAVVFGTSKGNGK